MEAEEIDRTYSRSVTELIGRLAPGMVRMGSGEVGANPVITSGRSRSFLTDDPPVLVVDGVRMPFADRVLAGMDPSEVAVLEVLPGSVAGWEFGSAGAGGVIRITLRKGLATGASSSRSVTDCVVPEFPRG
jgi:outer membrane cobalamin receptor